MTQEQEKALKIVEKLIDRVGKHDLTSEEIMILVQGIMSNECGGCNWKYVSIPQYEQPNNPIIRPGEIYCDASEMMKFKNEKEMIEELRLKFDNDHMLKYNNTCDTKICAGDNIPDMQYKIH